MKKLLIVLLIPACGSEDWDFTTKYGTRVKNDHPIYSASKYEIEVCQKAFLDIFGALGIKDRKRYFIKGQYRWMTIRIDDLVLLPDGKHLAGLNYGYQQYVYYDINLGCFGKSALIHEITHWYEYEVDGWTDPKHKTWFWLKDGPMITAKEVAIKELCDD